MGFLFTKHKRIIKIIKGTREGIQKIYVCIIYIISGTKIHHELNDRRFGYSRLDFMRREMMTLTIHQS